MKLETKLIRTFNKLENLLHEDKNIITLERFYSLIHHYEKLNERYKKAHGVDYNPLREEIDGYSSDLIHQHD